MVNIWGDTFMVEDICSRILLAASSFPTGNVVVFYALYASCLI